MLIGTIYVPLFERGDPRITLAYETVENTLGLTLNRLPDKHEQAEAASSDDWIEEALGGDVGRSARLLSLPWRPLHDGPMAYVVLQVSQTPDLITRIEETLALLGDALDAFWGVLSPMETAAIVADQIRKPYGADPPFGLPELKIQGELPPDVPQRLGWINYWSSATAARIGCSDAGCAEDLVWRSRPTVKGRIVRLTDEPLDLAREDHLRLLSEAYRRFPSIGGAGT